MTLIIFNKTIKIVKNEYKECDTIILNVRKYIQTLKKEYYVDTPEDQTLEVLLPW